MLNEELSVMVNGMNLNLLYGLNLSVRQHQTENKRIVREAISRVIQQMKDLPIVGTSALRSNEETQAEAFSPNIIQVDGESWKGANRIGRDFEYITSSVPCYGIPNLIQATSALFTKTELSRVGDEYIELPERFGLRKTTFCELIDCILIVSNRNLWFIAYHNEGTNTVGRRIIYT